MTERLSQKALSAAIVTKSLLYGSRSVESGIYRQTFKENAENSGRIPLVTEDYILSGFTDLVSRPAIVSTLTPPDVCYWNCSVKIDPFDIYNLAVQFLDDHDEPLPKSVLPPESDIQKYIVNIFTSKSKVDPCRQFEMLLEISQGSIAGAANIGLIASRLMARGSDFRAYPYFKITPADMNIWNNKITQFETYGKDDRNDGPGDTYYFWTHLLASYFYSLSPDPVSKKFDRIFSNGTQIMSFVRSRVAGKPTITDHREASIIGRNIGLALSLIPQK